MFGHKSHAGLVIVGLGNPGPAYARTRHNAGEMLVMQLAAKLGTPLKRERSQIRGAGVTFAGRDVKLGIPTSYMNVSGPPVAKLCKHKPASLIVVHDELDLPLGRVRLKLGGGNGGHNGLASISASLRSKDFVRLRLGISRPPDGIDPAEYVLKKFRPEEVEQIEAAIQIGIEALERYVTDGLDSTQNWLHSRT